MIILIIIVAVIAIFAIPLAWAISEDPSLGNTFLTNIGLKDVKWFDETRASVDVKQKFDIEKARDLVHEYVNSERVKMGTPALRYNTQLQSVAQHHSDDMSSRGYFDHFSPEHISNIDRFDAAGLDCKIVLSNGYWTNGSENLAKLGPYSSQFSEVTIAQDAVDAWLESKEGHRENMLASHWKSEGIGIGFNSAGDTAYLTQTFCN